MILFKRTLTEKNDKVYLKQEAYTSNAIKLFVIGILIFLVIAIVFFHNIEIPLIVSGLFLFFAFFAYPKRSLVVIDQLDHTLTYGNKARQLSDCYSLMISGTGIHTNGPKLYYFCLSILHINDDSILSPTEQKKLMYKNAQTFALHYKLKMRKKISDAVFDDLLSEYNSNISLRKQNSVVLMSSQVEKEINYVANKISEILKIPVIDITSMSTGNVFIREPEQMSLPFVQLLKQMDMDTISFNRDTPFISHNVIDGILTIKWKQASAISSIVIDSENFTVKSHWPLTGRNICIDTNSIRFLRCTSYGIYSIINISYDDGVKHIFFTSEQASIEAYQRIIHFLSRELTPIIPDGTDCQYENVIYCDTLLRVIFEKVSENRDCDDIKKVISNYFQKISLISSELETELFDEIEKRFQKAKYIEVVINSNGDSISWKITKNGLNVISSEAR